MKIILTLLTLACTFGCHSNSNVEAKTEHEPDSLYSGKIYTSTVVYLLDRDTQYIVATRLSSFQPEKSIDTVHLWGSLLSIDSSAKPIPVYAYDIIAKQGEQVHFESNDHIKCWLRESSKIVFSYAAGKVNHIRISGEGDIETPHAIRIASGTKLNMELTSGSAINVQNDQWDRTSVSLIKGNLVAVVEYPEHLHKMSPLSAGEQVSLDPVANTYKISYFDTSDFFQWRNAHLMKFTDANLETILNHLNDWYTTNMVYDSLPKDLYTLTIPYNTSMNNVLQILRATTNITFTLKGGTIYGPPRSNK